MCGGYLECCSSTRRHAVLSSNTAVCRHVCPRSSTTFNDAPQCNRWRTMSGWSVSTARCNAVCHRPHTLSIHKLYYITEAVTYNRQQSVSKTARVSRICQCSTIVNCSQCMCENGQEKQDCQLTATRMKKYIKISNTVVVKIQTRVTETHLVTVVTVVKAETEW